MNNSENIDESSIILLNDFENNFAIDGGIVSKAITKIIPTNFINDIIAIVIKINNE
jgi:hypothetical protein